MIELKKRKFGHTYVEPCIQLYETLKEPVRHCVYLESISDDPTHVKTFIEGVDGTRSQCIRLAYKLSKGKMSPNQELSDNGLQQVIVDIEKYIESKK